PNLVGLQERYLFLPVAASCLAIAALLAAARPALGRGLLLAIISTWIILAAGHWRAWYDASLVSDQLVGRLVAETMSSDVEEIVIANVPLRVGGASVAGDFQASLGVLGARSVPVRGATWVSYPSARAVALADPPLWTAEKSPHEDVSEVTVRLEVQPGPFRRYIGPAPGPGQSMLRTSVAEILQENPDLVRVTLRASPGRSLFAWDSGHLIPLIGQGATAEQR
ncbi:MAG TPA: hypothetical protein VFE84_12005, partial [Patescibacteria group bacterium]|nr:hypothetical protein [Patescibacteria group bacterium]